MAWAQVHVGQVSHIPCIHNYAPAVGVGFQLVQHVLYLVVCLTICSGPATPLVAIYRPQIALFIGPFIPYAYPMFFQPRNVGIALQKPQQFVDNRFQMHFFSSEQGKTLTQVETHLIAKATDSTGTRPVAFGNAIGQNMIQ